MGDEKIIEIISVILGVKPWVTRTILRMCNKTGSISELAEELGLSTETIRKVLSIVEKKIPNIVRRDEKIIHVDCERLSDELWKRARKILCYSYSCLEKEKNP